MTEHYKQLSEDEIVKIVDAFSQTGDVPGKVGLSEKDMEAIYTIGLSYYHNGKFEHARDIFSFLCFYNPLNNHFKKSQSTGGYHG